MPELTQEERLQPSLLDRLTDDHPHSRVESPEQRVLSHSQLQQSVIRDLAWLLNSVNLSCCQKMDNYPLSQASVINYGIPSLSGMTVSGVDPEVLTERVAAAIRHFEPRLVPNTVNITTEVSSDDMSTNAVTFMIEAVLWAQPLPIELFLRADVDLDSGRFEVTEQHR